MRVDLASLPEPGSGKNCQYRGLAVHCGPRGLAGESDLLFHNAGDGRFIEVGEKAGVSDPRGYLGLGVAWFDYDRDGWPDLYVANDSTPSALYHNEKNGTFKDVAFALGVAVSEDGVEQAGMGVAVGDYDNSGRLSLFKTNFSDESNNLYRNDGGQFMDMAFRSRTAASSRPYVGWGTAFLDYDNDGFLDLVAVNGHVYPQVDKAPASGAAGYRQRALLYHNRRDGTFDEVAAQAGRALTEDRVSRGLGVGDLDNDGRLDLVINDLDGGAADPAQRTRRGGQLAPGRPRRGRQEHSGDWRGGHRAGRHAGADPGRPERHELPLAGRHAPAFRSRRGKGSGISRSALARRNGNQADSCGREPNRHNRSTSVTPWASSSPSSLARSPPPRWWSRRLRPRRCASRCRSRIPRETWCASRCAW